MRWIATITVVVCFLIPESAFAQRFFRGHRDRWDDGGRSYYGGYYNRGYYPYWSFGVNGYGANGYWYPGNSYYSYSYPESYYYSEPRTSYYYDPSATATTYISDDGLSANRARLEVIVPDPNAEIYVQDQRMSLTGSIRLFDSPDLEQGKTYTYTIKLKRNISGRATEEVRKVEVKAGSRVVVDFNRPEISQMPSPTGSFGNR